MSDLGAIFHVKKSGTQYDAHAYTTTDECPEPNLKVNFNGTAAYIKLETKGSGDVPCYVKKGDGSVFQVKIETTPSGSISETQSETGTKYFNFTVPGQIHVLHAQVSDKNGTKDVYVGVTPNKTYRLYISISFLLAVGHRISESDVVLWFRQAAATPVTLTISWSAQINKVTPTVNDY